ncbi:MFS transporter [Streptomyces sp. NPDC058964]|uniref:MFS transporter n=1 Tax=Streptomyces sp. NPDC058964 TaxID=3346681 RepID=UPI0036CBCB22
MTRPAGRTGAFRNRDFARFWTAITASGLGSQVTILAVPLVAVGELHASPTQLGILAALQGLPVLVVTPFAGVVADRYSSRSVNVLTDLGRGLLLLAVPALAAADGLTIGWMYAIALAVGCLKSVADVAHHSILPSIVIKEELVPANAAVNASYSVSDIAGPGLGGLLIQALTAPYAVIADSLSFLLSGSLIASLPGSGPQTGQPRGSWWSMAKEGFSYLFRERVLLTLSLAAGLANVFFQFYSAVFILYAVQSLHFNSFVIGVTYGVGAVGGIAGAARSRRIGEKLGAVNAMLCGLAAVGAGMLAVAGAVEANATAVRVAVVTIGIFTFSAGLGIYNTHSVSTRQRIAKPETLGRVTASARLLSHGAGPIGSLAGGLIAAATSPAVAVAAAGVGLMGMVIGLRWTPFARIPDHRAPERDLSAA